MGAVEQEHAHARHGEVQVGKKELRRWDERKKK
jgi:hypothetical protein